MITDYGHRDQRVTAIVIKAITVIVITDYGMVISDFGIVITDSGNVIRG